MNWLVNDDWRIPVYCPMFIIATMTLAMLLRPIPPDNLKTWMKQKAYWECIAAGHIPGHEFAELTMDYQIMRDGRPVSKLTHPERYIPVEKRAEFYAKRNAIKSARPLLIKLLD